MPELFDDDLRIVGTETKLTGATDRLTRALKYRERVILVVDATVDNLSLKSTGDGPALVRRLKITDLYELDGERGINVTTGLRAERRRAEDDAAGRAPLPGLDDLELTVGPDGVVETVAEKAARLGEDVATEDADVEPWAGYDGETVAQVVEALDNTKAAAGLSSVGFVNLVARVAGYEQGHRKRSGVLNYCAAAQEATPIADALEADAPPLPGEAGDEASAFVDPETDCDADD